MSDSEQGARGGFLDSVEKSLKSKSSLQEKPGDEVQQLSARITALEVRLDSQNDLLERLLEKLNEDKSTRKKRTSASHSDSITSSEEEDRTSDQNRRRGSKDDSASNKEFKKFLESVSPKDCPKPENFAIETGMSYHGFIGRFERYCTTKYNRDSRSDWTAELGRFLTGEIKAAYDAYGGAERPYSTMKRKLGNFCDSRKDHLETLKHVTFMDAVPNDGESIRVFALRLEQLYINAYPNQDPETSPELRRKFLSSIPTEIAKSLERDLMLIKTVSKKKEVEWSEMVTLMEFEGSNWNVKQEKPSIWYGVQQPEKREKLKEQNKKVRGASQKVDKTTNKSPRRDKRNNGRCNWCGKPGHFYKECWGRLGCCLLCGSKQHQRIDCPKYAPRRRSSSNRRSLSRDSRRHSHRSDRSTDGQSNQSDQGRKKNKHRRSRRQARKSSSSSSSSSPSAGHSRKPRYTHKKKTEELMHQEN